MFGNLGAKGGRSRLVRAARLIGLIAPARLGSGTASSTTYLAGDQTYKAIVSALDFRNLLYANGGMEVWQRGAGGSASIAVAASTTAYTADRWYLTTAASQASTVSQQAGLVNQSRWAARVQRNSGQTGTGLMRFAYPLTTDECVAIRGQTVTLSFYTSTGANWSPTSGTLSYVLYTGTGAEGKRNASSFTGEATPISSSVNLATSASAAQTTATSGGSVGTTITQCELQFTWTPTGTASTNDWFQIDEVQIEVGSAATPFERLTFAQALNECSFHYVKTFNYSVAPVANSGNRAGAIVGNDVAAPTSTTSWYYRMRVAPTIVTYNPNAANGNWRNGGNTSDVSLAVSEVGTNGANIRATGATGTADYLLVHVTADAGL